MVVRSVVPAYSSNKISGELLGCTWNCHAKRFVSGRPLKESWGVAGGVIRVVGSINTKEKLALKVMSVGEDLSVSVSCFRVFSPRT